MIGRQEYQPTLFSTVNIESFIPKNHLLRKLDSILDFSFVREMTEHLYCSNNGRPSIDPELEYLRPCKTSDNGPRRTPFFCMK